MYKFSIVNIELLELELYYKNIFIRNLWKYTTCHFNKIIKKSKKAGRNNQTKNINGQKIHINNAFVSLWHKNAHFCLIINNDHNWE